MADKLPGFAISGYRSISGDPQWIDLSSSPVVFLGGNNSGKSNVLRLVAHHANQIAAAVTGSKDLPFDARLDRSRRTDGRVRVEWPVRTEQLKRP